VCAGVLADESSLAASWELLGDVLPEQANLLGGNWLAVDSGSGVSSVRVKVRVERDEEASNEVAEGADESRAGERDFHSFHQQ
jgi:hypothetical protein